MKVALAPRYRWWMLALLPTTFGLGTAILWLKSLKWPSSIDANGLTLRYRRKVPWNSIDKISVHRDYCDGRVARIDIYHGGSIDRIPTGALREGENIADMILATFKRHRSRKK